MRLRLVQLPAVPALGVYPTYRLAAAVQELLRRQFLHAKEQGGRRSSDDSKDKDSQDKDTLLSLLVQPPPPTVIAFTPPPTYTLGRRQDARQLSPPDRARLLAPLAVTLADARSGKPKPIALPPSVAAFYSSPSSSPSSPSSSPSLACFLPSLASTMRGGLTTYHGPGQAVLWPVLDLKSPSFQHYRHAPLTVRAYSRLLETTTADVLKRRFGLDAYTTDEQGLWVGGTEKRDEKREERKIAALGVHLRRNISALGVAVNLNTPVTRAGGGSSNEPPGEDRNPWARFVPCGIAGKGVSCVADEGRLRFGGHVPASWDLAPSAFAGKWAAALAQRLGLADGEVDVADAGTVAQLLERASELLRREDGQQ